jgi:hypothetical protein
MPCILPLLGLSPAKKPSPLYLDRRLPQILYITYSLFAKAFTLRWSHPLISQTSYPAIRLTSQYSLDANHTYTYRRLAYFKSQPSFTFVSQPVLSYSAPANMHFRSFVLVASAATAASAQGLSEACAAGALIGIFALCGSNPVDCGSGRCCLAGQTCVPADNSFRCADPELVPG